MTLQTLKKQAYEARLFQFDFSAKMATEAALATVVSIVSANQGNIVGSTNLTIAGQTIAGQILQAKYSGGTSGETYKITAKVTDSDGQELEEEELLAVLDE